MRDETAIGEGDGRFPATRWSAVQRARSSDPGERREAEEMLLAAYWKPIYKYLRLRWRRSNEDAKDLTQEFFYRLVERSILDGYDPEKARLRTYLRVCLDRLVQNEDRGRKRIKRGGDIQRVSLDFEAAEGELARSLPAETESMESYFEREWLRSLMALVVDALESDCEKRGRPVDFALFERYDLCEDSAERPTYAELAKSLDIDSVTVTNRLAAVRRRFRALALEKLAEVTGSEEEFRREARALFGASV
ncbi:MAG: sigma-70 family RNA polymerase sigma factor [Acidobacteriota bacterium]